MENREKDEKRSPGDILISSLQLLWPADRRPIATWNWLDKRLYEKAKFSVSSPFLACTFLFSA